MRERACYGGGQSDFRQFHKLLDIWDEADLSKDALSINLLKEAINRAKQILSISENLLLLNKFPNILVCERFLSSTELYEQLTLISANN